MGKLLSDSDKQLMIYSADCVEFIKDIISPSCTPPMQLKLFHREWIDLFNKNRFVSLLAPRGHGKQLADSTPILTTKGWKTHGELIPGDYVYHPSGKPIMIIATTEKTNSEYLVETRDGEIIRCHGNHEWWVYDRNIKKFTIMETKNMVGMWRDGKRSRFQLPIRKPLDMKQNDNLPLNPYYLGVWLGDGKSDSPLICGSEKDLNSICSHIPYKESGRYIQENTKVYYIRYSFNNITKNLRELNLINNKHIPEIYFNSSIEQRLELLAGLIDTDGSLDIKRGRYRFVNINYNLIKDIERLLISLGFRPYITKQKPHSNGRGINGKFEVYTIHFNNNIIIPSQIERKKCNKIYQEYRLGIVSVKYSPNGEIGNSIQVNCNDGLYLAGKRLIPTHNTTLIGAYIIWNIVTNPKIRILVVTINQEMADNIMSFIQRHLEGNDKLIEIFGTQRGYSDWSRSTLRVLGAGNQKDPTLKVLGITASMVGGHHNIIVLDDIMDSNNSRTEHRRKEVIMQFESTMMPMLEPHGKVLSIGTKWAENDIHAYLQKIPDYICKIYKAVIKYPEGDNGKAEVLWEERFPYEELIKIKERYGSVAFEMQYQNNIVSLADSPIRREWVEAAVENYKMIPSPFEAYMGVDLASKGEESDYFTITIIGISEGKIYVLDGLRTKASLFRQFELIKEKDTMWQPIRIGIEQAAQQKMIVDQLVESTTLPIIPIKSSIVNDRMSRVQRLSVLFETGRILLNPELQVWADEAIAYSPNQRIGKDDCIDSMSFAIQASQYKEEDKHIDWGEVSNMIYSKKNEESVRPVGRDRFSFTKV